MTEGDFCRASARSVPKSLSPETTILCSSRARSRRTSSRRARVRARGYGQHRGWLRGAVEQVAVNGSGRRGTSRGGLKRYLAISDCVGSEARRGRNIVEIQWRKLGDDLAGSHAVSDHPGNCGHWNSQPADARHATHLSRVDGDAIHHAIVSVHPLGEQPVSVAAAMVDRYTESADWTGWADEWADRRPRQRAGRTRRTGTTTLPR